MKSARELALNILCDWDKRDAYLNIVFKNKTEKEPLLPQDSAFLKELVFGTVKYKITLDYIISLFSNIRLKKLSLYILNILRLSIYQLVFMDKIPKSAAVNEGTNLAKRYGHSASSRFVNAVLRKVSSLSEVPYPDKNDKIKFLSVFYSHPEPLVHFFVSTFGEEKASDILKANMTVPPVTIRVNTLKTTKEELKEILLKEGITAENGTLSDFALNIKNSGDITKTKAYRDGLFTIQDEVSQLAAAYLMPKACETVLDMCAAPGGKTTHIAEIMQNKGEIYAFDLYEKRLLDVTKSAERLGIDIIKTKKADASKVCDELLDKADKILLDVPCSGLGILRRKPDIKYKKDLTDFSEITKLQAEILSASSKYLKVGGSLVYSTCTINPAENSAIISEFLRNNTNFCIDSAEEILNFAEAKEVLKDGMGVFLPSHHDGFFICRLKRIK